MIERPWPEWSKGKPISQRQIARLLKPFKVEPTQLWINGGKTRGYELDDAFRDACSRYIDAADPVGAVGVNYDAVLSGNSDPVCEKEPTE